MYGPKCPDRQRFIIQVFLKSKEEPVTSEELLTNGYDEAETVLWKRHNVPLNCKEQENLAIDVNIFSSDEVWTVLGDSHFSVSYDKIKAMMNDNIPLQTLDFCFVKKTSDIEAAHAGMFLFQ
jgi:hypothetical protein